MPVLPVRDSLAHARGKRAVRPRAGDRSPSRSGAIPMVGEAFSAATATDAPAIAGRRVHGEFRNNEIMPLICPTCQIALRMPAAACYFAWGCFRYLGARASKGSSPTSSAVMLAKAWCDIRMVADARVAWQ